MRTPDIVVKFTIKKDNEEGWVARCSALPNCAYAADTVPDLLLTIEEELHNEFEDANYIDGGVQSLNAEYSIFRQRESPLDAFISPEPKAEPAQEGPHV